MALTSPVVVGSVNIQGNDYPIFGTQDRATEYHTGALSGATFTGADFTVQQQALATAYRQLDRQNWRDGFPVQADLTVPLDIEFASYELAAVLIADPTTFNQRNTGSNQKRLRAGSVEIEFFSRTDRSTGIGGAGIFPPQVLDLIKQYLASQVSIITPTVGGTANQSNVLDVDQFGITEPL